KPHPIGRILCGLRAANSLLVGIAVWEGTVRSSERGIALEKKRGDRDRSGDPYRYLHRLGRSILILIIRDPTRGRSILPLDRLSAVIYRPIIHRNNDVIREWRTERELILDGREDCEY
ncbi:MAG: hypothetical protein ACKPKO_00525, partial [Candidatus Fonsibacter sp.]